MPAGKGQIDVRVLGATESTVLTVTQIRPRYHGTSGPLVIRNLDIKSGEIGSILAGPAELNGVMTPLTTSLSTLEFGAIGPRAQVDILGSVDTVLLGDVLLGPSGHVVIAGDVNGTATPTSTSSTSASGTGSVTIQGTVTGTITATGTGSGTAPTTPEAVGAMIIGGVVIDGGRFIIAGDSVAPIQIQTSMILSHNGLFAIGRDQTGSMTIGGSLILDSGGELFVGRNLAGLSVTGDVIVNPGAGGGIAVGGNLNGLTVNGIFRGQGSPTAVDLAVGLNLNGLNVLGGTSTDGAVQNANIIVGKNITGINVPHGIFRSWITAGLAITGAGGSSAIGVVGADGPTAIYNSEIDAGTTISKLSIAGDVRSGFPTGDPTGYPTRIIAGKVRGPATGSTPDQGLYISNGAITDVTVDGALIDSVFAASVAPYGGDGSLPPPVPYGGTPRTSGPPPAGFSNFNAPGGLTGPDGNGQFIKNYSIRSIINGQLLPYAVYDTATDPNVHVNVLENGTIRLVVNGGVVSTPHDSSFDFTGVFAVNTEGVNGGPAPAGP